MRRATAATLHVDDARAAARSSPSRRVLLVATASQRSGRLFEAKRAPRNADGDGQSRSSGTARPPTVIPTFRVCGSAFGPGGANSGLRRAAIAGRRAARRDVLELRRRLRGGLPYTPLAALLRDERMADNQKNNPDALCLPMGLMQLHLHPQPRKIVQTPGLIVMMYEGNEGLRQIFTGRPAAADARRESAAVVVRLFGRALGRRHARRRDRRLPRRRLARRARQPAHGPRQDDGALPPTEFRHAADRRNHRRSNGLHASPSRVRVNQRLFPDAELIEFICNENEKSIRHYDPRQKSQAAFRFPSYHVSNR